MAVAGVRRTQSERRQESELGLIRAAIDLIARQGMAAVTFEMLGRESGYSRGLVTQRFGSKQKLIESVLRHLHADHQCLLDEGNFAQKSGLDAILSYVDQCLTRLAERTEARAYFILLSSCVADTSDLSTAFRETHADVADRLRGWIRNGKETGTIRPDVDSDAAALMIGCMLFGISMQMMVDPAMDIEPVRELSLATLHRSLAL